MSLNKVLTITGSICSILGFFAMYIEGYSLVLSALVLVAVMVILLLVGRLPLFCMPVLCLKTTQVLTLYEDGRRGVGRKIQKFVPLYSQISRFEEEAEGDGKITSFISKLNGTRSQQQVIKDDDKYKKWCHIFDPLDFLRIHTRETVVGYQDSYIEEDEYYDSKILYPGFVFKIRIRFPRSRSPKYVKKKMKFGGAIVEKGELSWKVEGEFVIAEWCIFFPKVGRIYRLEWGW